MSTLLVRDNKETVNAYMSSVYCTSLCLNLDHGWFARHHKVVCKMVSLPSKKIVSQTITFTWPNHHGKIRRGMLTCIIK